MKNNQNNNIDNSEFNIINSSFSNNKEVHIGNNIHQEIHDNSINYEVNMEDIRNIETLSIYLTTHFNEKKIGIIGCISLISGLISIFTFLNSIVPSIKISQFLPLFSLNAGYYFFALGILLLIFGSLLINSLVYKQNARCKQCGKDYAYKPNKNSSVRDVEVREGTMRHVTKYYKCRHCNHEKTVENNYLIPNEEESKDYLAD